MSWGPCPYPGVEPADPALTLITEVLDPVLVPIGFAPGQVGAADAQGQVIFCRGDGDSTDGGCLDLVVDVAATPDWRVVDVRWWGLPADRWHLPFDPDGTLAEQLAGLSRTLPDQLSSA